jgi:DNA-binding response OmpR family regulator
MTTIVIVTQHAHIAQAMAELISTVAAEVQRDLPRVLPACTPDDVLNILAKGPIDILMVEHHLAGTTGFELVRWLEAGLTNTTKILLTDDSRILADPWTFLGREFNAVLPRPLGRQSLRLTLERWLSPSMRRRARRQGRSGPRAEASR